METIRILGAGPAGLTAAINLAKHGYQVQVFEKNRECGMRFHGDFQGLENWTSHLDILKDLELMNISIDFWHKPITECIFYDHSLNKRVLKFKNPGLYLIRRGDITGSLDQCLKDQALQNGVTIRFGEKKTEKEAHIVATGPRRVDGIVRGMTFETRTQQVPSIILDDNLAPKSFAYLLISDGRGCLGTGLRRDYGKANHYFQKTLKTFQQVADLDIAKPHMFTGYGNFFLMKNYQENKRIYVGEAAGLQDFLFAFGLRQAITSGYLAATSIITGQDYDHLIKKKIQPQTKISLSNRFLFSLLGNQGYSVFLRRGKKIKNPLERMHKQYNPSLVKKMVFPIAKLMLDK